MLPLPPPPIEYSALQWEQVLPPIKLRAPRSAGGGPLALPSYRLNLLAAHGDRLYLAAEDDAVYSYAIRRANGLSVEPVTAYPIVPPTPVNNVRVANFTARHGGPTLLLAGGDVHAPGANGSLSILRLPVCDPLLDLDTDENAVVSAETFYLTDLKSAWGLSADPASGRVALSTNSHCAVVLRMPEVTNPDNFPAFSFPPLAGTHFGNIPCVSFSHTGNLLGSASIDTTFAVFAVHPDRSYFRRMLQSPQRNPHDETPAEWCWALTWISPRTPRPLPARDTPALVAHRTSPASRSLAAVLREAPVVGAAAARIASLQITGERRTTRKRRRVPSPRRSPPAPPLYDDADGRLDPLKPHLTDCTNLPPPHPVSPSGGIRKTLTSPSSPFAASRRIRSEGTTWSTAREPEDSLFVIARESSLSLHRMVGRTASVEIDRVDPFVDRRARHSRLSEVVEIPEISALLVTQQYSGGIAVVRIVRRANAEGEVEDVQAEAHESIRYMLVVEGIIGGERSGWIAGSCVVKREVERMSPVFELFIIRADGTIEGFEISRRPCPVTAAWAVCT